MGAPISEEAIKSLPVLIPPLLGWVRVRGAALWAGLFLGVGFGLGEIWYLAWGIAQVPAYSGTLWWQFTGFLNERILVTLMHGILTAIVVTGIARGPTHGARAYLYATGLHAFTNIGAFLFQMRQIPMMIAGLWIFIPFTVLVLIFIQMYQSNRQREGTAETMGYQYPVP